MLIIDQIPYPLAFVAISCIILVCTAIICITCRYIRKSWNRWIPIIGIFVAGSLAYYPLCDRTSVLSQILDAGIKSLQLFVLNNEHGEITYILSQYPQNIVIPYELFLEVLKILAPICTAMILLSIICDLFTSFKIKYFRLGKRHVFSQLNEKTWILARSMKEKKVKGSYIFCGLNRMEREENPFYEDARKSGCRIIDNHILTIPPSKYSETNYFLISENGSENTDLALSLMDIYKGRKKINVFVMSNETETEYLLDEKIHEQKGDAVNLHHLNEAQIVSYDLLWKNPLFSIITPDWKKVSMLIIGSGFFGLGILKNALWCSRTKGEYSFEITIVDKDITRGRGYFFRACPDLDHSKYNISFHEPNIDADSFDLINHLEERYKRKGECYNYIVVATNHDDTNIKAAMDIRSWYQRNKFPVNISIVVRDILKNELITKLKQEKKSELITTIFPFSCINQIYNYENILNNPLEKMAICVNSVYEQTFRDFDSQKKQITTENSRITYNEAITKWRELNLSKKRSNMALALFLKYFLWMRGYSITDAIINEYIQLSKDEVEYYAQLEKERWNTYTLTEGFYHWPYEDFIEYINQKKKENPDEKIPARSEETRLHACITDWETIQKIDKVLGMCYTDFDREFVLHVADIISGFNGEFSYQHGIKKETEL